MLVILLRLLSKLSDSYMRQSMKHASLQLMDLINQLRFLSIQTQ